VSAERLRERLQRLKSEGRSDNGVLFPELEAYRNVNQPPGCLVFGNYPSGDALFLVMTGDLRGSVWCHVNAGVPELALSGGPIGFLAWFADALAEFENEA
jgi:hypothetical protein